MTALVLAGRSVLKRRGVYFDAIVVNLFVFALVDAGAHWLLFFAKNFVFSHSDFSHQVLTHDARLFCRIFKTRLHIVL